MSVTIDRRALSEALALLSRVAPKKSRVPVLQNVRISAGSSSGGRGADAPRPVDEIIPEAER